MHQEQTKPCTCNLFH